MAFWVTTATDAAYGEGSRADYTAIVTGARDLDSPTPKIHLLDVYQVRVPLEGVPKEVGDAYHRWRPDSVGIENTLWQAAIIRTMRRQGDVPFHEIDRRKQRNPDKRTRAGNLAFHYAEGHILHPRPAPAWMRLWDQDKLLTGQDALEFFENQLLAFTGEPGKDEHDDLVDAWVDVVDRLTLVRADDRTEPTYHTVTWNQGMQTPKAGVLLNDRIADRLALIARAQAATKEVAAP